MIPEKEKILDIVAKRSHWASGLVAPSNKEDIPSIPQIRKELQEASWHFTLKEFQSWNSDIDVTIDSLGLDPRNFNDRALARRFLLALIAEQTAGHLEWERDKIWD